MEKNKGQQRREASPSHIKRNSILTNVSNSTRHSPRKKRSIPQYKPMQSVSATSSFSPRVGQRTKAAAFSAKGKNASSNELSMAVSKRHQSPRKKQVTELVKSNPARYALPKVGKRTGEAAFAGKDIRINPDGYENYKDYWTDTETSTHDSVAKGRNTNSNEFSAIIQEKRRSPRKKQATDIEESVKNDSVRYALPKVGRRTGEAAFAGKRIKINKDGFENYDDYFTDEASNLSQSSLSKLSISQSSSNNDFETEKVMLDKACSTFRNPRVNDSSSISSKNKKDSFKHPQSVPRVLFSNEPNISESRKERDNTIGEVFLNEDFSSKSSPRKSFNTSRSTKNNGNISGNLESEVEFEKIQEKKSVSIRNMSDKAANKVSKSRQKNKLVEDSSEEDSDIINESRVPSPNTRSIKDTKNSKSSRNDLIEDGAGDLSNMGGSTDSPSRKSVSFRNMSDKAANKVSKSRQKNKLVEDSDSDEDSDIINESQVPSPNTRSIKDTSSKSSSRDSHNTSRPNMEKRQITGDECESIERLNKKNTRIIVSKNEMASNKHRETSQSTDTSPRFSNRQSKLVEDLVDGNLSHNTNEIEVEFEKIQEKKSVSFRNMSDKAANKVSKSRQKNKLVEDSDSEEDSDIINESQVPSPNTRSIKDTSSRSSSRDSHNTSRSSLQKRQISGDECESIERLNKKNTRIIVSKNEMASNKHRKTSQSIDTSPRFSNRQSKLVEDLVDGNLSHNTDEIEMALTSTRSKNAATDPTSPSIMLQKEEDIASIPPRFSPRNSRYSASKSPIKRGQLIEPENSTLKEKGNASNVSRRTLSNTPLQISQIREAGSSRHESRLIADQVGEQDSSDDKDSGTASDSDSKNAPPQSKESHSHELSKKKSLEKQNHKTSRSSGKKHKLLEEMEVEDCADNPEVDIATLIRSGNRTVADESHQIPRIKNYRSSRNDLIEDGAGDSSNVGGSTDSPSRKAASSDNMNKSKRKHPSVENDSEDLIQENEVGQSELASGGKSTGTKKSKKKLNEIPPEQLRRSKRERICPLAHWLGERQNIKIVKGEIVVDGVVPGRWEDDGAKAFVALAVQRRYEKSNVIKEKGKEPKQKPLSKTIVLNPLTNELVEVNLHQPFGVIPWSAVEEKDQKVPYYMTKTFCSEKINFGFLDICPLEQKTRQYSPQDNIHFVVQKGHVKVMIGSTVFEFRKNDSFLVPCTEGYSIENLQKSNALLSFTTFRVPFFPYQQDSYNE